MSAQATPANSAKAALRPTTPPSARTTIRARVVMFVRMAPAPESR